ncbi:hypothetical protein [Streptomyces niveus]|uniref:hypothetical protein n=1 Tax=Streptomyces niveus TaxID=193462 RepID=UPI0037A9B973
MPSYDDQPHTTYYPTPLPPAYDQTPARPYGQHVVPLPQGAVVYPPTAGIDGVVMMPGPNGQPVAYYTAPPAPAHEPLITPLLAKAALVAFILGVAGIGLYFLAAALVQLVQALVLLAVVTVGGYVVVKLLGSTSGSGSPRVSVSARGRARVQVHTGRGSNRGRGRR